ncbi:hypothetical protein ACFLTL_00595 [Chloroflexota bacterium]
MWRNRKFIVAILVGALLVTGLIGGVALAQDNAGSTPANTNDSQPTLLERVAEILGIDQQQLEDAFAQAQTERKDAALRDYLDKLVAEGKITQEEADEYWTWQHSRPDMTQYQEQLKAWKEAKPGIPPEFEEWKDATPDIPLPRGFGGFGMRAGRIFKGGLGFFGGR